MISSLLSGNFNYIEFLLRIPIVLIALSVHECAHGYAAYKMGDPTAKAFGRLTLNPIKHLDLFGTISMFLFGFGWAKPVPVNTRRFNYPKRGMAITAIAGPLSNVFLAFIGAILYSILYVVCLYNPTLIMGNNTFLTNFITG
jgi:Zn-dependent protease